MLDSLVRVSRRVGWVTDLLAADQSASLRGRPDPPQSLRRTGHCGEWIRLRRRELARCSALRRVGDCRAPLRGTLIDLDRASRRRRDSVKNRGRWIRLLRSSVTSWNRHKADSRSVAASSVRGEMRRAPTKVARSNARPSSRGPPSDRSAGSRLNPSAKGFRGPTRLPLSNFTSF